MEIISFNSKTEDIAEAIKGPWGKEVFVDCSIVYLGTVVIVVGDLTSAEKKLKCKHDSWIKISDKAWLSVVMN